MTADLPLFSGGVLDSTDILELVVFIEESFGISIAPLDVGIEHFDSLAAMTRYVERQTSDRDRG